MISDALLYGILDLGYTKPEDLCTTAAQLLSGGVDLLQLRAKGHSPSDITAWGKQIQPLCRDQSVPFVINDFPEVAVEVGADILHIGQEDGQLAEVRKLVGDSMLIGRSTHSVEQAQQALADGFDYIGFGPIYPTPTKKGRPNIGLEDIASVQETVGTKIPMFCIGGIKPENLDTVLAHGAKRVVIVSSLLCAEDIQSTTRNVKQTLIENL